MPAVPAIIMAGSAIASSYMAKRAADNASKRSPEEMNALTGSTSLAEQQRRTAEQAQQQGNQMFASAMPAANKALGYYSTLLGGNRAAMRGAVAPEAEQTASAYEGANRLVGNRLQGGARDMALAENARMKSGAIARLTTGVRPMAAQGAADVAGRLIGGGTGLYGAATGAGVGAGGMYAGMLQNGMMNRQYGDQAGQGAAAMYGSLFAQLMKLDWKGGRSGRSGGSGGFYPVGGGGGSSEPGDDTGWG